MAKMYKFDPSKKRITEKDIERYLQESELLIELLLFLVETGELSDEVLEKLEINPLETIEILLGYILLGE